MSLFLLFAQGGPDVSQGGMPTGLVVVLVTAAVMAVPIVAIITGVKHATKERELQHAERLKAIEHGVPLEDIENERRLIDDERRFRKGIMRLAAAIGVGVPVCAVGAATGAVTGMGTAATSMIVFLVWTGAAAVGVAGVAAGAWLANSAIMRLKPSSGAVGRVTTPHSPAYKTAQPMPSH